MTTTQVTPPSASLHAGVARRDITPPLGMYTRMWGAAEHDHADGVHRPVTLTVLALRAQPDAPPLLLASIDWCIIVETQRLLAPLIELAGGDEARVMVNCTHTHSVGFITPMRADMPGGDKLEPYLQRVIAALSDAAREAIGQSTHTPAIITAATGRCDLATNRDLPDPADTSANPRYICGFNPDAPADDTLLVLRVATREGHRPLATLVNYACHPTTLAWQNTRYSPDFIGAMRELVERDHGGLCLFLQGASGNMAPAHQYVGDPAVPDQHGRQLGYAVLSALAGMLAPGLRLAYEGVKESGAPLAVWRPRPFEPSARLEARHTEVDLPRKPWPSVAQLQDQLQACTDRALAERLRRQLALAQRLQNHSPGSLWVWHVGDIILVGQYNEAYPDYQQALRAARPQHAVVVTNVTNGSFGYLYPSAIAQENIYPVWQSPFAGDALDTLTKATMAML